MENKFYIEYDKMIQGYRVSCFGEYNVSASLEYLKNKDNHKTWKGDQLSCYHLVLDWVRKNHPELLI
jgi:hypothetical protein